MLLSKNACKFTIICLAQYMICDDSRRCIGTLFTPGERVVRGLYGVHVVYVEVSRGLCVAHVVSVYVVCSLTPSVDTSSVGSPRFCVSQARECSGLVPVLSTDEVLSSSWTPSLLC